jgi:hypothetical protein
MLFGESASLFFFCLNEINNSEKVYIYTHYQFNICTIIIIGCVRLSFSLSILPFSPFYFFFHVIIIVSLYSLYCASVRINSILFAKFLHAYTFFSHPCAFISFYHYMCKCSRANHINPAK